MPDSKLSTAGKSIISLLNIDLQRLFKLRTFKLENGFDLSGGLMYSLCIPTTIVTERGFCYRCLSFQIACSPSLNVVTLNSGKRALNLSETKIFSVS